MMMMMTMRMTCLISLKLKRNNKKQNPRTLVGLFVNLTIFLLCGQTRALSFFCKKMKFKLEYHRTPQIGSNGPDPVDQCVSIDIGTANLGIIRVTRFDDPVRYRVEHLVVVNICGDKGQDDVGTLCANLIKLFSDPKMAWVWEPASPIVPERQVDSIYAVNKWGKGKTKDKAKPANDGDDDDDDDDEVEEDDEQEPEGKTTYKPPIMNTVFGMIQMMVLARKTPAILLDNAGWSDLMVAGIDPSSDVLTRSAIEWIPRSGSQKSGLKGLHGDARKVETHFAAPRIMRENKDRAPAEYIETFKSGLGSKPREDACDCYLQAHHFLQQRLDEQNKKRKREEREQAKLDKIKNKNAKRQRTDAGPIAVAAPKKKKPIVTIDLEIEDVDDLILVDS
jgi:hypothetical protein